MLENLLIWNFFLNDAVRKLKSSILVFPVGVEYYQYLIEISRGDWSFTRTLFTLCTTFFRRHYSSRNFGRLTTRPTRDVSIDAKVVSTGAGGSVDVLRGR